MKQLQAERERAERVEAARAEKAKRGLGELLFEDHAPLPAPPQKKAKKDGPGGKQKGATHGKGNAAGRVAFGGGELQGGLRPRDRESMLPGDDPHRDGVIDRYGDTNGGKEVEESRVRGLGKAGARVEEESSDEDEETSPQRVRQMRSLEELQERRGSGDFVLEDSRPLPMGREPLTHAPSLHLSAEDAAQRKSKSGGGHGSGAGSGGNMQVVVRNSGELSRNI